MTFIKDLGFSHTTKKHVYHKAECGFCGKRYLIRKIRLLTNTSCGCMNKVTHGEDIGGKPTTELKTYRNIKRRCYDKNCDDYKNYGFRGITLCPRWLESYENFLNDMGRKPTPKHTIERLNVDGPYSPENCVWLEKKLQNKNTRRSHCVEINGEKMIVSDAIKKYGVPKTVFYRKLKEGIPAEQIILSYTRERFHGRSQKTRKA